MNQNLLENLNEAQLEAVTHDRGPLMIIAGAGTGKTTAITQRIAWLIEQGKAKPEEILALTFTEKAATEMEERVDQLLPIGYVDMWISTFHAFCERILRQHALDIGVPHEFTLLDEIDTYLLIRKNFDRFELDYYKPKSNPTKFIRALLQHFSRIKDEMITPEQYLKFAEDLDLNDGNPPESPLGKEGDEISPEEQEQENARINELANAYHTYQQILLENSALDFADLVSYTIELLRSRPRIARQYQEQFKFVLVDEFQDTNSAQYELIKLLLKEPFNITVVGDDDQSIYKFRGASLSNILNFSKDFSDAKQIVLNQNYRSSEKVLHHAYNVIQNNNPHRLEHREQINKELLPNLGIEGKVDHIHADDLQSELHGVISRIVDLQKEHECNWSDFAILVRANSHAEPFVEIMDQIRMPYRFLALSGLYTKPVILDCLAWMRVIDLPYDSPSIYRILSHPELGISEIDIAKLSMHSKKKGLSLFEVLEQTDDISDASRERITEIIEALTELRALSKRKPSSELFVEIVKQTGIIATAQQLPEPQQIEENGLLQKFFERVKRFEYSNDDKTLHHFLEEFEHERSSGESGALSGDPTAGPDVVQIMTIHASKGLEFRFVFLVNMVEQRFPTQRRSSPIGIPEGLINTQIDADRDEHIEEERRLLYVAMTRAKEHLYLFSADDYGGTRKRKPSRFVKELEIEAQDSGQNKSLEPQADPIDEKATVDHQLPSNISFTQIAAFSSCPLQYKYAHILRVPVFGRYQMSFGKTMHNALEQFAREYVEGNPPLSPLAHSTSSGHPEESKGGKEGGLDEIPPESRLLELYESAWIDEWYPDAETRVEYHQKGKDTMSEYYHILTETKPKIAFIEKDFTLKIGDISTKGRIDRIDKLDDGYEIVDYKTGKPKDKLSWPERKQLVLYALACERCFDPPLKITKATYHYLEDNSSVSFEPTDKEKQKLIDEVIKAVEKMQASDFSPTPGFHCQYCDFKDICEDSSF
ncbi:ATP-dependent helicase [Candidatus Uhrbacteria bacterium]|jgi:DNA helicase II / ATP-dependent DNA helicase PcrA|nr:ATP-dependent helicase [Candidatus Uhrbacteria bacterium]MBT7717447.1 ATP-dependent helicase [Candidatus Uhrbacteria bacterium]